MRAPLLKKIRISLRVFHDLDERCVFDFGSLPPYRFSDGVLSVGGFERADGGIIEKAFRIRLCLPCQSSQLWKASSKDDERQLSLPNFVDRDDECGEVFTREVLCLVDEDCDGNFSRLCSLGNQEEELREVSLQIPGVGHANVRDADLDFTDFHFECTGEAVQPAESFCR